MAATISQKARNECLEKMACRYSRWTGRAAKGLLLDEFCEVTGHERKYATKLLGGRRGTLSGREGRGRPCLYGEDEKTVIRAIWKACEQPCGKRLESALREWLPAYVRCQGALDPAVRERVLSIIPA